MSQCQLLDEQEVTKTSSPHPSILSILRRKTSKLFHKSTNNRESETVKRVEPLRNKPKWHRSGRSQSSNHDSDTPMLETVQSVEKNGLYSNELGSIVNEPAASDVSSFQSLTRRLRPRARRSMMRALMMIPHNLSDRNLSNGDSPVPSTLVEPSTSPKSPLDTESQACHPVTPPPSSPSSSVVKQFTGGGDEEEQQQPARTSTDSSRASSSGCLCPQSSPIDLLVPCVGDLVLESACSGGEFLPGVPAGESGRSCVEDKEEGTVPAAETEDDMSTSQQRDSHEGHLELSNGQTAELLMPSETKELLPAFRPLFLEPVEETAEDSMLTLLRGFSGEDTKQGVGACQG